VRAEEEVKYRLLVGPAQFPVAVGHGQLVQIGKQWFLFYAKGGVRQPLSGVLPNDGRRHESKGTVLAAWGAGIAIRLERQNTAGTEWPVFCAEPSQGVRCLNRRAFGARQVVPVHAGAWRRDGRKSYRHNWDVSHQYVCRNRQAEHRKAWAVRPARDNG
jgi:hypothetical protein